MTNLPFEFDERQLRLRKRIKLSKEERQGLALERAFKYVQNLKAEGFGENTLRVLHTISERLCFVLELHPSAKGNYRVLEFYYKKHFEGKATGDFEKDVVRGVSPESIFRVYRKLQEHGFYNPSLERVGLRSERENVFRKGFGSE